MHTGRMGKAADPQQWLKEHGDYLFRYAMSRLHEDELAADLLQETLLAAWRSREQFAGQSSLRTWLTGILKHKIIDHIRGRIRERRFDEALASDPTAPWFHDDGSWAEAPQPWHSDPEALCRNGEFATVLQQCIERLPDQQQAVFRLRELLGEDTAATCKQCDITSTHLHVLLHRARLGLRRCLEWNWFNKEGERS